MDRMIEELYRKYHQELVSWCQSMTGNLQTAEELVQEAFLRAMLHENLLEDLKEKQCRSWLYRTVKNLYVDRLRHARWETVTEELPERNKPPEEVEAVEWEMLLDNLPGQEGVIFTLRYLEGYTSSQIGEILSLPPGTVRSKLFSARKHIKEALGGKTYVR